MNALKKSFSIFFTFFFFFIMNMSLCMDSDNQAILPWVGKVQFIEECIRTVQLMNAADELMITYQDHVISLNAKKKEITFAYGSLGSVMPFESFLELIKNSSEEANCLRRSDNL